MKNGAKTKSQMADLYDVSIRTFNRWLKDKGIDLHRGLICPKELELIFSKLGYPPGYEQWHKKGAGR